MGENDASDTVTPDMIGQVTVNINADCITVTADVTRNGITTNVVFDDPEIIGAVFDAAWMETIGGMHQAVIKAICGNYEAECHMYQSVF